ncbi:hypothetical protein SBRCBS47491_000743 [Sporothrix bragantina]|uniref:Zn(2)-C6 fungal-type domain-containing protein n=1 Tax=Sporothrix bragantina TaxID=671064 RepID=A0ABP0ASZ3_9PEZI
MDAVKFVPPGGHRACLSCSAAKAKCVFADDADAGDSFVDGLDFINSTTSDLAGPQAAKKARLLFPDASDVNVSTETVYYLRARAKSGA